MFLFCFVYEENTEKLVFKRKMKIVDENNLRNKK